MVGLKTEKPWGFILSSSQLVYPPQWQNHARQLMAEYSRREVPTKVNILGALVKVMDRLDCTLPVALGEVVIESIPGVIEFNDAFRVYMDNLETEACSIERLKQSFETQLMNERLGLPVVIVSHSKIGKFIVLKSSYASIEYILSTLLDKLDVAEELEPVDFSFSEIKSLMSSDFDRKLLELAVSAGKSKSDLTKLGINVVASLEEIKSKVESIRSLDRSAEEKAQTKLNFEIDFIVKAIESNKLKLEVKKGTWPENALKDLMDKIDDQEDKREKLLEIQTEANEHSKALLRRRVLQAKKFLIRDQKLKQVGRSQVYKKQGAKRKLADSDDEFVASMFSEHAGYHGLRNTVTEFVGTVDRNKRIKLQDIKKYYDIRRAERGQSRVSTGTARRRLAPRRKNSQVSKSHTGRCLISIAVPPRTGDSANENTHFARKFRSNLEKCLFSHLKFLPELRDIESNSKRRV